MKKGAIASRRLLIACALAALLSGCFGHSQPTEFYTLSPLPRPAGGAGGAPGTIVAVYPAVIPAAIDRPQIVTRTDENQIMLSEFNRWGGSLKEEISRTLVENLGILLADRRVSVMSANLALDPACFVAVTFNRFDGRLGDS
ncbi:MAG TPA: PqiC family protein, partial [Desulfobacterales bacterium]|nr:PqiC family protein [Desulfobacterales bacterium]